MRPPECVSLLLINLKQLNINKFSQRQKTFSQICFIDTNIETLDFQRAVTLL